MTLEGQYRRLFTLYPREYRRHREDEMVSILVDSADGNRSLVPIREVRPILGHALETRLWASPEWRAGSALAGLVATFFMAFVVMAGLGVAFQADHVGVATQAWWAVLAVCLVAVSLNHRVITSQVVSISVTLVGVVAGASLTGVTRGQTVPLLLTVVLVSLSAMASERRRQMAAGVGMAAGATFLIIFWYRLEATSMVGPRRLDPWRLALGIVEFQPAAVLAILAAGLLLGLWRRRFGIAVCLIALPSALFVQGLNAGRVQFSYQVAATGAAMAVVVIYGLITTKALAGQASDVTSSPATSNPSTEVSP